MIKRIVTEGIAAGASGAGVMALWLLLWDAARGVPFRTPALLGAAFFRGARDASTVQITLRLVLGYSVVHFAAFALFGLTAAALLAAADRQPALRVTLLLLRGLRAGVVRRPGGVAARGAVLVEHRDRQCAGRRSHARTPPSPAPDGLAGVPRGYGLRSRA